MFWLFQVELQIYFSSKSLKNLVKVQRSENSNLISDWLLGHWKNLWKLEFVVLRIDWWILWTSYYVDLKVIQISREITEVRKFKCGFLRKILAPLWIPYIIGDWIAAFFNSFCQNLPCGTNQDQSLCSRTWLNTNDCLLTALLNGL